MGRKMDLRSWFGEPLKMLPNESKTGTQMLWQPMGRMEIVREA